MDCTTAETSAEVFIPYRTWFLGKGKLAQNPGIAIRPTKNIGVESFMNQPPVQMFEKC